MPGILPDDIGTPACRERMSRIVVAPGDSLAGTELGALIAEKQTAVRADTVAAERKQREDTLGEVIDHVLQHELAAEYKRTWPTAEKIKQYTTATKTFNAWARDRGLGYFPARASSVAAYLIDAVIQNELTAADAKEIARAIEFCHDVGRHYLERAPIAAALKFIDRVDDDAGSVVEASDQLLKPKANGKNGAAHADEVQVEDAR